MKLDDDMTVVTGPEWLKSVYGPTRLLRVMIRDDRTLRAAQGTDTLHEDDYADPMRRAAAEQWVIARTIDFIRQERRKPTREVKWASAEPTR